MSRYKSDSDKHSGGARAARRMDPFYVLMLILVAVVAALTVSVVAFLVSTGRTGGASSAESAASSEVESAVSSEAPESAASDLPESADGSSSAESSGATSGSGATSSAGSVEDAAMATFEENTIDRKKEAALLRAQNTTEILSVYDATLTEWKTAVNQMVTKLRTYRVELSQEQADWLAETDGAIAAKDRAAQEGGSAQLIEAAEYKCQLYRDRARILFGRIAQHDPAYRF